MSLHLHGRGYSPEELREQFIHLKHEFGVFIARAPEAMREDPVARYAIVKGDSFTVWETSGDGYRYAYMTFGIEPFLSQELSERGLEAAMALFPEFRPTTKSDNPPCPPSGIPLAPMVASSESASA
jgi:hypothetical protein